VPAGNDAATAPTSREITIVRLFDAPRALVFKAWTDPVHLARWWGPKDFTNPVCELDLHPGGKIHIVMRAPHGAEYPMVGEFREVVAPERLVFTNAPVDAQGNRLMDGLTTVTFADERGKTKLTMHTRAVVLVPYAAQFLSGMDVGWNQSIDRLGELVAKM
jgi:uncharacterized protein YndB with AHSA1/START domain